MRNRMVFFSPLALVIFLSVFNAAAFAFADRLPTQPRESDRVAGQYIVVFKASVTNPDATENDLIAHTRGESVDSYRTVLRGFAARLTDAAVAQLEHDPRVAYVVPDRVITVAERTIRQPVSVTRTRGRPAPPPPTNPAPSPTPPPTNSTETIPTGISRVGAAGKTNTGAGVQVAVIDTGIDSSHPDLSGNVLGGYNCTSGNTSDFGDYNGHGTHVAGSIAAEHNSFGVVGVASGAKLWSIRVLDSNGSGTWSSVICGLDVVAANAPANGGHITVANMSLGGTGTSDNNCGNSNNDPLHQAICRVRDAGVTIVVAAGNSGANASTFIPAAYSDAVISVSALTDSDGKPGGLGSSTSYGPDDTFATFSNYGSVVDIAAPGVNIYSTWPGGGYKTLSGTSMATPHVAGAAALYLASHPGASWTQVRDGLAAIGESNGNGHADPSGKHSEPVLYVSSL